MHIRNAFPSGNRGPLAAKGCPGARLALPGGRLGGVAASVGG